MDVTNSMFAQANIPAEGDFERVYSTATLVLRATPTFLTHWARGVNVYFAPVTALLGFGFGWLPQDATPAQSVLLDHAKAQEIGADTDVLFERAMANVVTKAKQQLAARTDVLGAPIPLVEAKLGGTEAARIAGPGDEGAAFLLLSGALAKTRQWLVDNRGWKNPLVMPLSDRRIWFFDEDVDAVQSALTMAVGRRVSEHTICPLPFSISRAGDLSEYALEQTHPGFSTWMQIRLGLLEDAYTQQGKVCEASPAAYGQVAPFEIGADPASPEHPASFTALVPAPLSSVPAADYIAFLPSSKPGEEPDFTDSIKISFAQARQIWPEGFQIDDSVWPLRYKVNGFPDVATQAELSARAL